MLVRSIAKGLGSECPVHFIKHVYRHSSFFCKAARSVLFTLCRGLFCRGGIVVECVDNDSNISHK